VSLDDLDPVLSSPKRLAAMALVANSTTVEFRFIKEHLGLGDSDLSKQMSALEGAGYLKVNKTNRGRGGATWYRASMKGLRAFERHVRALEGLARDAAPEPEAAS
jgi:DNA-binding transcriptional ArsR family regulator